MFFDSHCHLTDSRLAAQFDDILARMNAAKVSSFINIGSDVTTSRAALKQCQTAQSQGFLCGASAGIHPSEAQTYNDDAIKVLLSLQDNPHCVAVGEIGLDYFYDEFNSKYPGPSRKLQQKVLLAQLQLASDNDIPVIIHNRDADADLLDAVKQFPNLRGVFHCFNSSWEFAQKVLLCGFHLGFTGMVTFKKAESVREEAQNCPLDRLLIETDSPYLAPVPHRGKTNEPTFVPFVAQKIAELRGVDISEIAQQSAANTKKLFGLDSR